MDNLTKIIQHIANAQENLKHAKQGYKQFKHGLLREKELGFKSFVIFSKSVIDVLKQLRKTNPDEFQKWGTPYLKQIQTDPLIKFFVDMRSNILKEGQYGTGFMTVVEFKEIKPEYGISPFINDEDTNRTNRMIIRSFDETASGNYIDTPVVAHFKNSYFTNMPKSHLGKTTALLTVEGLCELYIVYLENLLKDAEKYFIK